MLRPQAVFVDRDGTIGGSGHFVHPRHFAPYPRSLEALNTLRKWGIAMFAFTHQHRIRRGEATVQEFWEEFRILGFDDAFICPHDPLDGCACHKPLPGLLWQAAHKYDLDLTQCVVIGDVGATDMLAAHAVGAVKVLVRTGWGESSWGRYRHTWESVQPNMVATDFLDAVQWILQSR